EFAHGLLSVVSGETLLRGIDEPQCVPSGMSQSKTVPAFGQPCAVQPDRISQASVRRATYILYKLKNRATRGLQLDKGAAPPYDPPPRAFVTLSKVTF
ncbi:Hypothetical protein FKW44_018179, partial [Caligus rogercresseyi]